MSTDFAALWHREGSEHDLSAVVEEYAQLYASPRSRLSPADRERCAYRAARGFDALGQRERAHQAYDWVVRNGRTELDLVERGRRRLHEFALEALGVDPSRGATSSALVGESSFVLSDRPPSRLLGADPTVREALEEVWKRARKQRDVAAGLESILTELELERVAADDLAAELRERGVDVTFEDAPLLDWSPRDVGGGGAPPAVELRDAEFARRLREAFAVDPAASRDRDLVDSVLARLYERALRSIVRGDASGARRDVGLALALDVTHRPSSDLHLSLRSLGSRSAMASVAERRLYEWRRELSAATRRDLRGHLTRYDSGRPDRTLRECFSAARRFALRPRFVMSDPDVPEALEALRFRFSATAPDDAEDVLTGLWETEVSSTRIVVDRLVVLVDALYAQRVRAQRSTSSSQGPLIPIVARLAEELRVAAAATITDASRRTSLQRELELLRQWFPESP